MKITGIHIDGFGVWHDRTWSGLAGGVNVFHGPNEAGKTTLMSFVRAILFGFERRSHPRRYEPAGGGNHGGWLEVIHEGRAMRIERAGGRHVRGAVRIHHDGGSEENAESKLEELLGGTTRTLYHNVFAFGLEELEQFRTLEDGDVASHISGAGMGVGAMRWSRVWKDLEDRRSQLFLPRGQKSTINEALKQLETVRSHLGRTETEPEEYARAHGERGRLEAEVRMLEGSTAALRKRVAHYEKLRRAEPYRARRSALEAELATLKTVERFPDGGVERWNLLAHQRRQLEDEIERLRTEIARRRAERLELAAAYSPQELIRRTRKLESLRLLLPRLEMAESLRTGAAARAESARDELAATEARREAIRPPRRAAVAVLMTALGSGAVGLWLADQPVPGVALVFMLGLIAYGYRGRKQRFDGMDRGVESSRRRLESFENEMRRASEDRGRIAAAVEHLTGRAAFSDSELERENAAIQEMAEMADRIRSIDEALAGDERHQERLGRQIHENQAEIEALLAAGGALSESDFFERADLFGRRRRLLEELARIPAPDIDPDAETEQGALDPEAYRKALADLEAGESRLRQARTEAGRVEERIAILGRSEERSRARLEQESILARLDEASEKWAVLTLCRTLLDETRRIYETDRQPEVLRHASRYFSRMSDGRWKRVIKPLDSTEVLVESAAGDRLSSERLSRGTAEQLYLATRLALVREYSRHVEPLPVVFDDIFVNFDPERARRSIEAVRDLSETHQILIFTCHPHLVRMLEEIVPGARAHPLQ